MTELKPCPTPRTDAARNRAFMEYQVLYPAKRARPVNDLDMAELERELIATQKERDDALKYQLLTTKDALKLGEELRATQLALKECGEALSEPVDNTCYCHYQSGKCSTCKRIERKEKALSNPLVKKAMESK